MMKKERRRVKARSLMSAKKYILEANRQAGNRAQQRNSMLPSLLQKTQKINPGSGMFGATNPNNPNNPVNRTK